MRRAVQILVGFLGALTLLGFLGRFWWPFELMSFFRPYEALLLAVLALAALPLRQYATALAAVALAAADVAPVAIATGERPAYPPPLPGTRITLLLLNVHADNDDHDRVAALIRRERADVVGLTELTPAWARSLAPALRRYPRRAAAPAEGFFGIGLYGDDRLRRPRIEPFTRGARDAAVGTLDLGGRTATLVLVHPPFPVTQPGADDRRRQLVAIGDAIARGELGPRVAVCGDVNAPPWSATARRLVERGGLTDTARGYRFEGSWPSFLPGPLRLPLDNCLIRGLTLVSRATGPRVGSDHLPLIVELAVPSAAA